MVTHAKWAQCTHLVLVAGHAVFTGDASADPTSDDSWCLLPFQKGEPPAYIEHIQRGVQIAALDEQALLVFSGGQTRPKAGPRSEAEGYKVVAEHFGWWGRLSVSTRCTVEEYARDSLENLLFGICRFFECVGRYPAKFTVVSWRFKQARFDMHRAAIQLPAGGYAFEGVNNPVDLASAEEGEQKTVAAFSADPLGHGEELGRKRLERNPFNRTPPYSERCPGVQAFLAGLAPPPWAT